MVYSSQISPSFALDACCRHRGCLLLFALSLQPDERVWEKEHASAIILSFETLLKATVVIAPVRLLQYSVPYCFPQLFSAGADGSRNGSTCKREDHKGQSHNSGDGGKVAINRACMCSCQMLERYVQGTSRSRYHHRAD